MGISYGKRALLRACLLSIFAIQKSAAALAFTNPSLAGLTAGVPFNLTWSGATGTTTVTLRNGTEGSLNDVEIIATGLQQSFIVWTPPSILSSYDYVLQLKDISSLETITSDPFRLLPQVNSSEVVTAIDHLPPLESQEAEPHYRPAPSHPNISLTAKIGVAVGSVTLTLLVIGIVVFYRRRHRDPIARRSMSGSSDQFLNDGVKTPSPEMGMFEPRRPPPVELERGRRDRRSGKRSAARWS